MYRNLKIDIVFFALKARKYFQTTTFPIIHTYRLYST
jgi:hypothetical protein